MIPIKNSDNIKISLKKRVESKKPNAITAYDSINKKVGSKKK